MMCRWTVSQPPPREPAGDQRDAIRKIRRRDERLAWIGEWTNRERRNSAWTCRTEDILPIFPY